MVLPLEGDIPNKYRLYKVYMGLIIKGTISSHRDFPMIPPTLHWLLQELDSRSAESTQSREILQVNTVPYQQVTSI